MYENGIAGLWRCSAGLIAALLLVGCGSNFAGTPVLNHPDIAVETENPEDSEAVVGCSIAYVAEAIAADTGWNLGRIQDAMSPAQISIKNVDFWCTSGNVQDGNCVGGAFVIGEEWTGGEIVVAQHLHALAHEFRHQVAYRLTDDPQGAHKGWTEAFEENYRTLIEKNCDLPF
jgi:hypothetical protein